MIKQRSATFGLCLSTSVFLVLLVLLIEPQSAQAQWVTNGTNINSTNPDNVGIGTTSPLFKLDVVGSINAAGALCLAGECKFTWQQIAGNPSQWSTGIGSTINFMTSNVGIGTTNPLYRLDVQGGSINTSSLCIGGDCKTAWSQVTGGNISSVFGRTGAVVAATNDYTWAQINKTTSSLADLTTRSADDLSSGTLPSARFPLILPAVSGANLTTLNASNISSGTVATSRLGSGTASASTFLRGDNTWQPITSAVSSVFGRTGAVVAATNDYTWAQINKTTSSLADLTTRSADDLSSGTLPSARFPLILPAVSGANLTTLNASNISSGTVATSRLGSGTASASTFLRGDNTWQPIPGAVSSVFGRTGAVVAATNDYTWAQINKTASSLADLTTRSASDLSSGTLPDARFPAILPATSGVNLTTLNASNLTSGTVATPRLGKWNCQRQYFFARR